MAVRETSPRAGVDYPRAWHELNAWFPDDEACLAYLERLRWGDGFVCRFCGLVGGDWWTVRRGLGRCAGVSPRDVGDGGHDRSWQQAAAE